MPKRTAPSASLRGGLLRLMMASYVHVVLGPTGFLIGFLIAEVIAQLSEIKKEDMHMVHKAVSSSGKMFWSCVKSSTKRLIAFWECHRPYRLSLLMSSCNSSEKV